MFSGHRHFFGPNSYKKLSTLHTLPQTVIKLRQLIRATEYIISPFQKADYYYSLHVFDGNHGYNWQSLQLEVVTESQEYHAKLRNTENTDPGQPEVELALPHTVCSGKPYKYTHGCFQLQYNTPLIFAHCLRTGI